VKRSSPELRDPRNTVSSSNCSIGALLGLRSSLNSSLPRARGAGDVRPTPRIIATGTPAGVRFSFKPPRFLNELPSRPELAALGCLVVARVGISSRVGQLLSRKSKLGPDSQYCQHSFGVERTAALEAFTIAQ
jgi:hypothetical protein